MRAAPLVLASLLAALLVAPAARADGDPASDILISQDLFLPYSQTVPDNVAKDLYNTVLAANKAGYRIKVALIASRDDLGLIQSLWQKPKDYAPFLGRELLFVYKGTLVIEMPNGFGVFRNNKDVSREAGILATVQAGADVQGLARSMVVAVRKLSAAAGHPLPGGSSSKGSSWLQRVLIGVAAAAVLLALVVLGRILRRRRSAELRPEQ